MSNMHAMPPAPEDEVPHDFLADLMTMNAPASIAAAPYRVVVAFGLCCAACLLIGWTACYVVLG